MLRRAAIRAMPAATNPQAHFRPVIRIKRMARIAAAYCKPVETPRDDEGHQHSPTHKMVHHERLTSLDEERLQ